MVIDLTRDEIIALCQQGGWLGRYAPSGDWWRYLPNYVPFSDPDWKSGLACPIAGQAATAMLQAGELVVGEVNVLCKMRLYVLAPHLQTGAGGPVAVIGATVSSTGG